MIIQQKHMGKKIQNYCLQNVIGQGQFGKVYRAINEKTQQVVAIKVIRIQKFKISPKLEQFTINEIQTLSKIEDTTNIVKFIQILKTANNYYFVYEFCNGGTLEQLIKESGNLSQERSLHFFKELLKAFVMLYKNNIMHRDIKPSNILINNGIIKLADFGFCKPLKDSRDLAQTMLGSPIYMAPQILKGEVYTIKADIWSLGVVLYEMLFGYCPFEQKTIARLISLIDQSSVQFPSHIKISKKLEDLLRKMLVKDHFKRISWDQLFNYDLSPSLPDLTPTNPFAKKHNQLTNVPQDYNLQLGINLRAQNYVSSKNTSLRKVESSPVQSDDKKLQRKAIKSLLDSRTNIYNGFKIVQEHLTQSSSKTCVHLCCYIIKKIQSINRQISITINRILNEKQNYMTSVELRKVLSVIIQQKNQIQERVLVFQNQLASIAEPQDIIFMRYAEQQNLTQEKDGIIKLLEIDDFLSGISKVTTYSKYSKKQLLDEYQKRVSKS